MSKVTGVSVWFQLFPWHRAGTPEEYAEQRLNCPEQQKHIDALGTAVGKAADVAVLKELRDIAGARVKGEDDRQASITTRAQGLFAALTLFGFVLTFAASLLTAATVSRTAIAFCGLLASYVVAQVVVIVVNISHATRGIGTRTAGSSDLARWAESKDVADFYRAQALAYLDYYRRHSLTNSWRFARLEDAVIGVRNIVVALGLFALTLFAFAIFKPGIPTRPAVPIVATRLYTSLMTCTVSGFAPARHQLGPSGVKGLKQTPADCFNQVQESACSGDAAFIIVVGHADKRELSQQPQSYYGSNLSLAYQRALGVAGEMVALCQNAASAVGRRDLSTRIWALASGAANVGLKPGEASLEADRSVEIRAYGVGITHTTR